MNEVTIRLRTGEDFFSPVFKDLRSSFDQHSEVRIWVPTYNDGGLQTPDPVILATIVGSSVGLITSVLTEAVKAYFQRKDAALKSTKIVLTINRGWLVKTIEGTDVDKVMTDFKRLEDQLKEVSVSLIEADIEAE